MKTRSIMLLIISFLLLCAGIWFLVDISETWAAILFSIPTVFYIALAIFRRDNSKMMLILCVIGLYFVSLVIWLQVVQLNLANWVFRNLSLLLFSVSIISAFYEKKWLSFSSAISLNLGILSGILLGIASKDPAGAMINNNWLIAVITIAVVIAVGVILQIIAKQSQYKSKHSL